jgi:hypothetical protein
LRIALSPATLIVVFGGIARNAVRTVFAYPEPGLISPRLQIAGRVRRFVFLAHPNAQGSRLKYPKTLPPDQLSDAQQWLAKARH